MKNQISKFIENDKNNTNIIKKHNISQKSLKKSNSQRILNSKKNDKNFKYSIYNNYKNINRFNSNKHLSKYNNVKSMKNYQKNENMFNNNSTNCFSERIIGLYSKINDSKNSLYQNKTDLISKSKYDSVPPELLI